VKLLGNKQIGRETVRRTPSKTRSTVEQVTLLAEEFVAANVGGNTADE